MYAYDIAEDKISGRRTKSERFLGVKGLSAPERKLDMPVHAAELTKLIRRPAFCSRHGLCSSTARSSCDRASMAVPRTRLLHCMRSEAGHPLRWITATRLQGDQDVKFGAFESRRPVETRSQPVMQMDASTSQFAYLGRPIFECLDAGAIFCAFRHLHWRTRWSPACMHHVVMSRRYMGRRLAVQS